MCNPQLLGTILNPPGAIAPDSGIGQLVVDPAAYIGQHFGGQVGAFIDPAGGIRDPDAFQSEELFVPIPYEPLLPSSEENAATPLAVTPLTQALFGEPVTPSTDNPPKDPRVVK